MYATSLLLYIHQYTSVHTYLHIYIYIYIRHRALCRVRGNEASELGTHSILLFDGLPNFTDLIQVSTYLEDCFVSKHLLRGPHTLGSQQHNHTRGTVA